MNWPQLKTILWLRWRLTRNQWVKSGGLGAIVVFIVSIGAIFLALGGFVGGLAGGLIGLRQVPPTVLMSAWLGITIAFLFFWMIGLLSELQRSETIDLQRLMHLPVRLGQIFLVNFIASHFAVSIAIAVPAMLGLAIGLAVGRSPMMILLVPLALAMVFMVTSWTYCLRGWLATLMTNPRRRRAIIMGITLSFILLFQGPNLYFTVFRNLGGQPKSAAARAERRAAERETFRTLVASQKYIPPLWLPVGAQALADDRPLPALLGTLGCLAIGALGLHRAYRSTLRFYLGNSASKKDSRTEPQEISATGSASGATAKSRARWLELRLPGVPEQAAALALATLRSMLRAPEVKMAWATSFIVTCVIGGAFLMQAAPKIPEIAKPFVATGSVAFSLFLLLQFLANPFGFDRHGFRALVLCPAERKWILFAKNLAVLPVAFFFSFVLLCLISFWLRLPALSVFAAVFQFGAMLVLAGLAGNLLAILVPYRMADGSMKPTKMPAGAMLLMVLFQMLFPIVLVPAFMPPLAELLWRRAGLTSVVPVNLLLSCGLAAFAAFAYWAALNPLGRLLRRRETKILETVTAEVE